ncbi:FA81B protein, partial [Polyodon spathula]|nr:FA81B protein [Polyodon spathula]
LQVLEGQILQWDGISSGTSLAVQNLDHKHLAGIGDLRGRVARCDASISKLSGDVSSSSQEIQKLQKETHDVTSALEMHKELELKITQLLGKMETSVSEQNSNLRAARGDQLHELQLLDVNSVSTHRFVILLSYCKTLGALADVREQIHSQRKWAEVQLSRSQQEMTEKKMQDSKNLLTVRLEKCEERQELEIRANRAKHAEDKLTSRIRKVEKIWEEPEIIKTEYRSGTRERMSAGYRPLEDKDQPRKFPPPKFPPPSLARIPGEPKLMRHPHSIPSEDQLPRTTRIQTCHLWLYDSPCKPRGSASTRAAIRRPSRGFESIHDAISSLRQINETNNRMHKEKVQKDIKQIRRKLVQLKDV